MNTEEAQVPSEEAAPPAVEPARAKKRQLHGWQVTLVILVSLLVVTVGVQAWFLHDLRREVIGLRERTPAVSVAPTWDQDQLTTSGRQINPLEQMKRMQDAMNRAFNHSLAWYGNHPLMDLTSSEPKMDIRDEPGRFVVEADVPGATQGSVKVQLNGQELTIQGNRESQTEQKDQSGQVVREERETGVFSRSVMLPEPVAQSGMKSQLQDGVLTITIPKVSKG
jgi:HSP20 family molecular chaperone IbpA